MYCYEYSTAPGSEKVPHMVGGLRKSVRFGLFAQLLLIMLLTHTGQEGTAYTSARQTMVTQQIKKRGIRDERVLPALTTVPRHLFAPPAYRDRAYQDEPLPIGQGQTISQPSNSELFSDLAYNIDKITKKPRTGISLGLIITLRKLKISFWNWCCF